MDIRYDRSIILLIIVGIFFMFSQEVSAANIENIKMFAKFWEYKPRDVKRIVSTPIRTVLTNEELEKLSKKEKDAYFMLLAASCIKSNIEKYREIYRYRCLDQKLNELFQVSLSKPKVLLLVKEKDLKVVIGYLNRFVEFLKKESDLDNGMPVDISFVEYLLEIKEFAEEINLIKELDSN